MTRSEAFLRILAGPGVALHVSLGPEPLVVRCAPSRIEHALGNMVANARDAVSREGRVDISLQRTKSGGISLCVADSGPGIPQDVADHLFEPFFTTKGDRGGTGLGLASVKALAEKDGGVVSFRSEAGCGATFMVTWPVATAAETLECACGELASPRDGAGPPGSHTRLRSAQSALAFGRPLRSEGREGETAGEREAPLARPSRFA